MSTSSSKLECPSLSGGAAQGRRTAAGGPPKLNQLGPKAGSSLGALGLWPDSFCANPGTGAYKAHFLRTRDLFTFAGPALRQHWPSAAALSAVQSELHSLLVTGSFV